MKAARAFNDYCKCNVLVIDSNTQCEKTVLKTQDDTAANKRAVKSKIPETVMLLFIDLENP